VHGYDFKAKNFVNPSASPRFCKVRLVPYAMKPLVEAELDKLVTDDFYHLLNIPIVPVMKADKLMFSV